MFFPLLLLCLLVVGGWAQVQVQLTSYPHMVDVGKTYTITWVPADQSMAISFYTGDASTKNLAYKITTYAPGGSYQWVVNSGLISGTDYHLFLSSLTGVGGNTYSDKITVNGAAAPNTTSTGGGNQTNISGGGSDTSTSNSGGGGSSGDSGIGNWLSPTGKYGLIGGGVTGFLIMVGLIWRCCFWRRPQPQEVPYYEQRPVTYSETITHKSWIR